VPKTRKQLQREKALQQQSQRLGLQGGAASVTPEQLLSAPQPKPCQPQQAPGDQRQRDSKERQEGERPAESCNGRDGAQPRPAKPNGAERKKVELQEKSRWEILQQEQRLIEEKNKRKKALLARAIAER
ncbi:GORAB protein, partial [Cisticola juncidis]|nr:GORAB protein [Cisticola juncidis]